MARNNEIMNKLTAEELDALRAEIKAQALVEAREEMAKLNRKNHRKHELLKGLIETYKDKTLPEAFKQAEGINPASDIWFACLTIANHICENYRTTEDGKTKVAPQIEPEKADANVAVMTALCDNILALRAQVKA